MTLAALVLFLAIAAVGSKAGAQGLIIDHSCTDISKVPVAHVETAKTQFRVWYAHTSHGSQITSGMSAMAVDPFLYSDEGTGGTLAYDDSTGQDLGADGDLAWATTTRNQLDRPDNTRNLVMWSWCGQVSGNSEEAIDAYLNAMTQLESDYPDVTFVYMTGHLDGTSAAGNLNVRNNQIRDYCRTHNKVLFDFADIESYDPDGICYLDLQANDNCDYFDGSEWRNWATEWCDNHPGECSTCSCAHSQSLNCDRKGRAFWWMLARLTGWGGSGQGAPSLTGAVDHDGGAARLEWTNACDPPAQFLGLAWDIYGSRAIWQSFAPGATAGDVDLGFSGAYHAWISNQYPSGAWLPCSNPKTFLMYSGSPHAPAGVSAQDLGAHQVRLTWDPEIYGTWHCQIICYQLGAGWMETQGPGGQGYWQYMVYPGPAFMHGRADLTVPASGDYWFYIRGVGWLEPYVAGEFAAAFVSVGD